MPHIRTQLCMYVVHRTIFMISHRAEDYSPSIVVYVPCNWFVFLSLNTPEEGAFTSKTDSANAALTLCPEQKPARKKVNRKTEAMRSDKKPKMTSSADDGNEGCD